MSNVQNENAVKIYVPQELGEQLQTLLNNSDEENYSEKFTFVPMSYDELKAKFNLSVTTDNCRDIFLIDDDLIAKAARDPQNKLIALDELGYTEEEIGNIFNSEKLMQITTQDGRICGVPFDKGVAAYYYDRKVFDDIGVNSDALTNVTWQDLKTCYERIMQRDSSSDIGMAQPLDYTLLQILLRQTESVLYDSNGNITGEGVGKVASLIKELSDYGVIKQSNEPYSDIQMLVSEGRVAGVIGLPYVAQEIMQAYTDADQVREWCVTKLPVSEDLTYGVQWGGRSFALMDGLTEDEKTSFVSIFNSVIVANFVEFAYGNFVVPAVNNLEFNGPYGNEVFSQDVIAFLYYDDSETADICYGDAVEDEAGFFTEVIEIVKDYVNGDISIEQLGQNFIGLASDKAPGADCSLGNYNNYGGLGSSTLGNSSGSDSGEESGDSGDSGEQGGLSGSSGDSGESGGSSGEDSGGSTGSGEPTEVQDAEDAQIYTLGRISEDIETDPEKALKEFSLPGGGKLLVNLVDVTTKMVFADCTTEDSTIPVTLAHVYDGMGGSQDVYGKYFDINLQESLLLTADRFDYFYTDPLGHSHSCDAIYYYINDSGSKQRIEKNRIVVSPEGRLTYTSDNNGVKKTYDVITESCEYTGLTFTGKLTGLIQNLEYFDQRSEELKQVEEQIAAYQNYFYEYIAVNRDGVKYTDKYLSVESEAAFSKFVKNEDGKYILAKSDAISVRSLLVQKSKAESDELKNTIEDQIELILAKSGSNVKQLKKYFKEYRVLKSKLERLKKQQAVNYAIDGDFVKAFNEDGKLVAIFDAHENVVNFEYDDENRLVGIYNGDEKEITLEYGSQGKLNRVIDGRGRVTGYKYEDSGCLNEIIYSDGNYVSFAYPKDIDEDSKIIITVTDSTGKKTEIAYENEYFSVRNCVKVGETDELLREYKICNQTNQTILIYDQTREIYDYGTNPLYPGNALVAYTEIFNGKVVNAEKYGYGSENINERHIERAKKVLLNRYSLEDFVYQTGEKINVTLNSFDLPTKKVITGLSENGNGVEEITYAYRYDANNRCTGVVVKYYDVSKVLLKTAVEEREYSPKGSLVKTVNFVEGAENTEGKNIVEYVYDEKGREIKRFSYNTLDTGSKFYSEKEYDEIGKEVATFAANGEKTSYEYFDETRSLKAVKYPNGSEVFYGKDVNDEVTAITQSTEKGIENSTIKTFDKGRLTKVESGNTKIEYEYDEQGRTTKVTLDGKDSTCFLYEEVTSDGAKKGDKVTTVKPNGDKIETVSDNAGNVLSVKCVASGNTEAVGQWTAKYSKNNAVTEFVDNVTVETSTVKRDKYARTVEYSVKKGEEVKHSEAFGYDSKGRLSKATVGGKEYVYAYAVDFGETAKSVSVGGYGFEPTTDKCGRYSGKRIVQGDTEIAQETVRYIKYGDRATNMPASVDFGTERIDYEYDKVGNIVAIRENGKLVAEYVYDAIGRLLRENNEKFAMTYAYRYDENGNMLSKSAYAFTRIRDLDDVIPVSVETFVYDGDRLVKKDAETFTYDSLGNPTTYRGKTAVWSKGRLTSYDGTTFEYDGTGRRISKGSVKYTYSSDGKLIKQSNGLEFIYDLQGLAGFTYGSTENDKQTYFYRKDVQGNIVAILDNSGNVVVKYIYDAWGNCKVLDADGTENVATDFIGNLNPYRYRGYYFDAETGLYYLVSRYYAPALCRFISRDSFEYANPDAINGINLYAYCNDNPVMNVDPTGTHFVDDFGSIADWVQLILKMAIGTMIGMSKTLPNVGKNVKSFSVFLGTLDNHLSNGFTVLGYLTTAVSGIISGVEEKKNALNIATDVFFDWTAITLGAEIGSLIGSIIPGAGTIIGGAIGTILGILYMAFESSSIIQGLKQSFYEGVNTIVTNVGNIIDNIGNAVNRLGNTIWGWLCGLFG